MWLNHPSISGINPILWWDIIFLIYCWTQFSDRLLSISCIYAHEKNFSTILLFVMFSSDFDIKVMQPHSWEMTLCFHPLFFFFFKCHFFLKCLEEFNQTFWNSGFGGTIFVNELMFLVDIRLLWYSISSSVSFSNLSFLKNYHILAIFNVTGINLFSVLLYCLANVCSIFSDVPFYNFDIDSWFFFLFS